MNFFKLVRCSNISAHNCFRKSKLETISRIEPKLLTFYYIYSHACREKIATGLLADLTESKMSAATFAGLRTLIMDDWITAGTTTLCTRKGNNAVDHIALMFSPSPSRNYSIFTTSMRLLPLSSLAFIFPVLPSAAFREIYDFFAALQRHTAASNEATNSRNKAAGKCSYPQSFPTLSASLLRTPVRVSTKRNDWRRGETNFFKSTEATSYRCKYVVSTNVRERSENFTSRVKRGFFLLPFFFFFFSWYDLEVVHSL